MKHAQEHLAQANRHIAELMVQIVRQRVIVKYALDTGQPLVSVRKHFESFESFVIQSG